MTTLPGAHDVPTTRFGAAWCDPQRAVGVLRARASRLGVALTPLADPLDAPAAVIAVDAWMLATGATSLELASTAGPAAVAALAAALSRAAGDPGGVVDAPDGGTVPDAWLVQADFYAHWAHETTGAAADVLARAAADLSAGAADPRLRTVAACVAAAAEG